MDNWPAPTTRVGTAAARFASYPHSAGAYGLTRCACRIPLKNSLQKTGIQTCPPLSFVLAGTCWMVGWWASGKLRPARGESSFALSRCMPDGACRSLQRVCMAGVAVQKPRSQVRPALHPVAAKSLSVALWKVPAVAPGHGVPAGNQSAVRVTSLKEAVPRRMVDVQNTMQSVRGFGIITRNGAIRR